MWRYRRAASGAKTTVIAMLQAMERHAGVATGPPSIRPLAPASGHRDVVGVLDALGRRSAHLAGISMGGALAQQIALAHPDRVDSLVLTSTSPAVQGAPGRSELPPMSEDLRAYFAAEIPLPDGAERTAVIDYIVFARSDAAQLGELVARIDAMDLKIDLAQRRPLTDLLAVHNQVAAGQLPGKTILTP